MAISASQFETVDGFSNGFLTQRIICQQIFLTTALFRFFGWGGEDDDFFQRLASKVFETLGFVQGRSIPKYRKNLWTGKIVDWIVELRTLKAAPQDLLPLRLPPHLSKYMALPHQKQVVLKSLESKIFSMPLSYSKSSDWSSFYVAVLHNGHSGSLLQYQYDRSHH